MGRKRQISQAESQIISADPGHQGGGASPPRQPWAVLRASFPKAWGRGKRRRRTLQGETGQSGLSQVTGSAQGAVTVTAGTPRQRRDCGLSPLWSPPQSPEPSPCGEKDIRQIPHEGHHAEHLRGPPQKRRVIRTREVCKTVTQRGGFGRCDGSRQGGVPDGILGQKKTLGKHLRRPE